MARLAFRVLRDFLRAIYRVLVVGAAIISTLLAYDKAADALPKYLPKPQEVIQRQIEVSLPPVVVEAARKYVEEP